MSRFAPRDVLLNLEAFYLFLPKKQNHLLINVLQPVCLSVCLPVCVSACSAFTPSLPTVPQSFMKTAGARGADREKECRRKTREEEEEER